MKFTILLIKFVPMKNSRYLLCLLILFSSCKDATQEPITQKDAELIAVTATQFNSGGMEISSPFEYDFDETVKTAGKIDVPPQNRAQITSFVGGYIKTTSLLVGDKVKKGQELVTLENTEFLDIQKEYLDVAEQLNYLQSEYDRQKTLYDEKITSQKNFLKAESEFKRARGMYQSLRAKLLLLNINPKQVENGKLTSTITLYAPISGDIVVMNVSTGMHVSPSDVILDIIETSHLHLELNVFEKDILKVKEGQKITFTVPEASNELFNAEVHLVGKSIEGNDRTINVHGHLDDSIKQKLLTGMFVEAAIVVATKKGLALPIDALISENNNYFVLLLDKEKDGSRFFKKIAVKIGTKTEKLVEIIPDNKINLTSKIVTKGVFDLTN